MLSFCYAYKLCTDQPFSGSGNCIRQRQFKCTISSLLLCIEQKYVLDNVTDCADASDECESTVDIDNIAIKDMCSYIILILRNSRF